METRTETETVGLDWLPISLYSMMMMVVVVVVVMMMMVMMIEARLVVHLII
jgi:hypothetical protein